MTARPKTLPRTLPKMDPASHLPEDDTIEQGRRLLLVDDRGLSLTERLA
jgi:hypothetical protein